MKGKPCSLHATLAGPCHNQTRRSPPQGHGQAAELAEQVQRRRPRDMKRPQCVVRRPWEGPPDCLHVSSSAGDRDPICTFPVAAIKNPPASAGDAGSISGSESPGEGNGNPPWYSCLGNPMDRGTWQATVHGVAKSWTQLSD